MRPIALRRGRGNVDSVCLLLLALRQGQLGRSQLVLSGAAALSQGNLLLQLDGRVLDARAQGREDLLRLLNSQLLSGRQSHRLGQGNSQ